jgi:hypothetical protein
VTGFFHRLSLEVVREADNAQHHFEWTLFRGVRFVTTRPTEQVFVLPAGFLLLPSQPFRYNVLFNDVSFQQQQVQPTIETVQAAWVLAVQNSLGGAALSTNPREAQTQVQQATQAAYPTFCQQVEHTKALKHLTEQFYWNPGGYRLSVRVQTARPDLTFPKQWRFELTEAQSQQLRLNAPKVVQEACHQYIGQYYFAFAPYHEAES